MHLKRFFKNHTTDSGTTHQSVDLENSIRYISNVFFDYQYVSEQKKFLGNVCELGAGDSNGVALMFLAHGSTHIDLPDRFYSFRNKEQQNQISESLIHQYPILKNISQDLDQYCRRYYGEKASGEQFFEHHQGYNFIVSRSVLEHTDKPEAILKKMYNALNPGGMLIHKVDLRDHGMFTPFSHSLKFLQIPKFVYRLMTYGSGFPNRFLFHRYKKILVQLNSSTKFYVSGLHGVEPFEEIYPLENIPPTLKNKAISFLKTHKSRFSAEFSDVSLEDLMISSFFFVCKKSQK